MDLRLTQTDNKTLLAEAKMLHDQCFTRMLGMRNMYDQSLFAKVLNKKWIGTAVFELYCACVCKNAIDPHESMAFSAI